MSWTLFFQLLVIIAWVGFWLAIVAHSLKKETTVVNNYADGRQV